MSIIDRIVARADIPRRAGALPRPLVFTNGVFDILHPGHVLYLEAARAQGATLVVGINDDNSARNLGKGTDRPINRQDDRASMLAALASVDLVTFFSEPTPIVLIHEIIPDLYVKGGDYDIEKLEETRVIRSLGGDARAIPFTQGYSTTSLLQRIRAGFS